jgi:transposase
MKCSFCQRQFDPEAATAACGHCPSSGGCHLIKCPHCGYESPREPKSALWLRKFFNRFRRERRGKLFTNH